MTDVGFHLTIENRIARLALAAPPRNVLTAALQSAMANALREANRRDDFNLLVVESAVPGAFSAGANVAEHLGRENVQRMLAASGSLVAALLAMRVPTLAAVDGPCLGGGFELVLGCDHWLVSDRSSLGLPEITLGCFPPAAMVLGPQKLASPLAAAMITTGRVLDAAEFCSRGNARCVPAAAFATALQGICAHHAGLPRGSLEIATRLLRPGAAERFEAAFGPVVTAYLEQLLPLHDAREGPEAFLAKRKPAWNHQSSG
jgi:cyclohexa-1,5-dienecarbonyl-CoA hydratase